MAQYLLDTNHLGAAVDDTSALFDRIYRARQAGDRFVTCVPVLCELEAGFQQTRDPAANQQSLSRLLRYIRLWPLDRPLSEAFGRLFVELRRAGIALSQVDMMLASLARQHGLTILTTDRDFERVAGIRVENWLAAASP